MTQKTILITGASSGIGAATARKLNKDGWRVALAARTQSKLDDLVEELGSDTAKAVTCDVANFEDVLRCVNEVVEHFDGLDAVFANAGVGGEPGGFSSAPVESWRKIVDVNILGLAHTLQATLPAIKAAKGQVVITGSVAGRRSLPGSMYSASKYAANAIGYNLRGELEGTGVRVSVIEPGMVNTPFFDEPKPNALQPEDIANSIAYVLDQPAGVDVHELLVLPTPKEQ